MTHRPNSSRLALPAALLLLASLAVAQYALDANLAVGAGRANPARSTPAVQRDIYTVNRTTGELQYNRANAFNDPVYRPYQRYTLDRFEYFEPGTPKPTRTISSTAGSITRTTPPNRALTPNPSRYSTPTPGFSKPMRRSASSDIGASIAARQYTPTATRSSSAMTAPTYRITPTRAK